MKHDCIKNNLFLLMMLLINTNNHRGSNPNKSISIRFDYYLAFFKTTSCQVHVYIYVFHFNHRIH